MPQTTPSDHDVRADEFHVRDALPATAATAAAARKRVPPEILARCTRLDPVRSLLSTIDTFGFLLVLGVVGVAGGTLVWPAVLVVILMPAAQHRLAILSHEATHYRLFKTRALNDFTGWLASALIGISVYGYRVIHRIHHNHLYEKIDPDMPLQAGYPRGRAYLFRKLGKDLLGVTAWKNYAYFFGAPAMNRDTGGRGGKNGDPLADTTPALRRQALVDRWRVAAFQLALMGALLWAGWLHYYLVLWVLPLLTLYQAVLRLRAVCEHGAPGNTATPLTAARTNVELPLLARFYLFPHHVNYHIEHHLYPAVPHYHLPRLHTELKQAGLLQGAEVRAFRSTLARVFADPPPSAQPRTPRTAT
ncbi:MAG TPA: fatty acid desaturase family protein [Noviherbaspirillum sp.]|nr:fatty acid desaturase family protein [Noviherbaspirillum sp.]